MIVGELYDKIGKLLKEGRLKREEKLLVNSNGFSSFDFGRKGFPVLFDNDFSL